MHSSIVRGVSDKTVRRAETLLVRGSGTVAPRVTAREKEKEPDRTEQSRGVQPSAEQIGSEHGRGMHGSSKWCIRGTGPNVVHQLWFSRPYQSKLLKLMKTRPGISADYQKPTRVETGVDKY